MPKLHEAFRNCYPKDVVKRLSNKTPPGRRTYIASPNVIFIAKPGPDQDYLVGGNKSRFEWEGDDVFGREINDLYRERRECILSDILGPDHGSIGGEPQRIHADKEGQALEVTSWESKGLCEKCRKLHGFMAPNVPMQDGGSYEIPFACAEDTWEAKKVLMDMERNRK